MSLTPACFEDVVGISRTTDDCYGTPPSGYDTSASGLYLDEAPGMNLERIFSLSQDNDQRWAFAALALEEGQKRFQGEVLKHLIAKTKPKRPNSRSTVAGDKASQAVNLRKTYHGADMTLAPHRGGTMTIHRIGTYMKFNGSVTVDVYTDDSDDPIETYVLTADMNKRAWTEIDPLQVDMATVTGTPKRVYFLFQPTEGQQAMDSKVASCGCSGKPKWNPHNPYYTNGTPIDGQPWTAWMMVGGISGDDLSDREDWSHTNETNGLMFDVSFACDSRTSICYGTPDYNGDPLQATYAHGVRFAAALYVVEQITGSTRVIRENIAGGDAMELLRVSYQKEINERAEYLGEELSEDPQEGIPYSGVGTYSDCFACRDQHGLKVQRIPR
ncbi:MAG TPA: hypothetical protein PKJ19_10190 [Flavobacteriales bacterium]|nr:hypothetical protein [Flavobacteriales bacterium]